MAWAPRPPIVQAPARAGIGLAFHYHERVSHPSWPEDWWQRNYDTLIEDTGFEGTWMTERMLRLPPPPTEATP